jgi:hypothetical protein
MSVDGLIKKDQAHRHGFGKPALLPIAAAPALRRHHMASSTRCTSQATPSTLSGVKIP